MFNKYRFDQFYRTFLRHYFVMTYFHVIHIHTRVFGPFKFSELMSKRLYIFSSFFFSDNKIVPNVSPIITLKLFKMFNLVTVFAILNYYSLRTCHKETTHEIDILCRLFYEHFMHFCR